MGIINTIIFLSTKYLVSQNLLYSWGYTVRCHTNFLHFEGPNFPQIWFHKMVIGLSEKKTIQLLKLICRSQDSISFQPCLLFLATKLCQQMEILGWRRGLLLLGCIMTLETKTFIYIYLYMFYLFPT